MADGSSEKGREVRGCEKEERQVQGQSGGDGMEHSGVGQGHRDGVDEIGTKGA